ncbi:MAG: methylenetetrahydrofolate--tRNA-(uracil(54)-C(5))-methyltransferase (FADH(2)-oxidizing) TrmFO [Deltaproteobacteria bacterium]|nr:methylenetetrahydrofolate--tRNA-(uracil(54)-C(5))-methyltransferase (FADH(2)-oxidizing) TrmFO [Deltaproteobacteria bacterium]
MPESGEVAIVGSGLAGSEAAWQLAQLGRQVDLYEMRPQRPTPAHKTSDCAELVCSNSFKSHSLENAHGLLKAELNQFGSLILQTAEHFAVPAGQALAIDRQPFSASITQQLSHHPNIHLLREEVEDLGKLLDHYAAVLVATGPLTSDALSESLQQLIGIGHLSFYDAIAPVVTAESINSQVAFRASRYGKGEADYLNCPFSQQQYEDFVAAILTADKVPMHQFEDVRPFEGCLPIEIMAERGLDTLRFGPMKPVGLPHPETGKQFHAIVQLRQENTLGTLYNLVGFQTKMTWTAQQQIFRTIPGLEEAEFVRLGSIHRNTFLNSPKLLTSRLQLQQEPRLFFAGQLTGVEGYTESTSMGLAAAYFLHHELQGDPLPELPSTTMMGGLIRYLTTTDPKHFQPMNANFGLLEPPQQRIPKPQRKAWLAERATRELQQWRESCELRTSVTAV